MRTYETIFILKPDTPEEETSRFVTQMEGVVASTGGTLQKTDRMGRRRLAYQIQKYHEGEYVLLATEAQPATVLEIEHYFSLVNVRLTVQYRRNERDY